MKKSAVQLYWLRINDRVFDSKRSVEMKQSKLTQKITPAAQRALNEAQKRRDVARLKKRELPKEIGGRKGPEPVRFGDWEKNGIVSDF